MNDNFDTSQRRTDADERTRARFLIYALLAVFVAGFALRLWGLTFGLPDSPHSDEAHEVNRALQLGSGSFNFERMGKGGYFYLLFLEFGLIYIFLSVKGVVSSAEQFAIYFFQDPTIFYLAGRATTALIGAASVLLVYMLGARVFSRVAGLVAAVLLSINLLHSEYSRYINVDIPLTFIALVTLYYSLRLAETGRTRDYIFASAFAALAAVIKLPGLALVVPVAVAHLMYGFGGAQNNFLGVFLDRKIFIAIAAFLVVFFLGNPGALLFFDTYVKGVIGLFARVSPSDSGNLDIASIEGQVSTGWFYFQTLRESMGVPVFMLGWLGCLFALLTRDRRGLVLFSFLAFYLAGLTLANDGFHIYDRYALPIVPVMLIFAGGGLTGALALLKRKVWAVPVTAVVISLLLSAGIGIESLRLAHSFTLPDSRSQANAWFEENVAEGSRVLIEGYTARPMPTTVQLRNSRHNLDHAISQFREEGSSGKAKYFELELRAVQGKRFDLVFYNWHEPVSWQTYRRMQPEYVVVRPVALEENPKYLDLGGRFLAEIRSDDAYVLAVVFVGEEGNGRGARIEVYRKVTDDP